jgi:hypothetical protein
MRRIGKDEGYVVAFSFTRDAREEVARARVKEGLDIRLVTVKELLVPEPERRIRELASVTEMPLPPSRAP